LREPHVVLDATSGDRDSIPTPTGPINHLQEMEVSAAACAQTIGQVKDMHRVIVADLGLSK
jgi:hypothetical protein